QRALPIIEQMQWIAAGSAFASPMPSLDLLAATAINAQMIVDLGKVYGQTFSLEQAKKAAGTLAELLVKLGLVELSTQVLGSLLKTHAATYLAGGAVQGVSAAYLTRVVGLSLVEFFEEQSLLPVEKRKFAFDSMFADMGFTGMGDRLQTIFKTTKQGLGLQAFVQQTLAHLPVSEKNSVSEKKQVAA
ncbi:MAG: YcjF family protein, partial [Phormidesmis sp.]